MTVFFGAQALEPRLRAGKGNYRPEEDTSEWQHADRTHAVRDKFV